MKKIVISIIVFAVALLAPQITQAQGSMTYLSNLSQVSAGSLAVGSDSWLAAAFRTGNDPSGYILESIELAMADASGNPSGFSVYLYSAVSGAYPFWIPDHSIGTINNTVSPATSGIYTFTTISNMLLSPSTPYFIVATSATAISDGAYNMSYASTTNFSSTANWDTLSSLQGVSISTNGAVPLLQAHWMGGYGDYAQFAINATAVPEPGVFGLLGLSGLAFVWHRRNNSRRENRD